MNQIASPPVRPRWIDLTLSPEMWTSTDWDVRFAHAHRVLLSMRRDPNPPVRPSELFVQWITFWSKVDAQVDHPAAAFLGMASLDRAVADASAKWAAGNSRLMADFERRHTREISEMRGAITARAKQYDLN